MINHQSGRLSSKYRIVSYIFCVHPYEKPTPSGSTLMADTLYLWCYSPCVPHPLNVGHLATHKIRNLQQQNIEKTSTHITLAHLLSCKHTVHIVLYYDNINTTKILYTRFSTIHMMYRFVYVRRVYRSIGYIILLQLGIHPMDWYGGASCSITNNIYLHHWLLWIDILFKWQHEMIEVDTYTTQ